MVAAALRQLADEGGPVGAAAADWPAVQAGIAEWARGKVAPAVPRNSDDSQQSVAAAAVAAAAAAAVRPPMLEQPVLRAGWRFLNAGDLVHARVTALEPMPPERQGDLGAPR